MVSKTKVREILKNPKLTDEQVERLQSDMYALAEIFIEELSSKSGSNKNVWVIDSANQKREHGR